MSFKKAIVTGDGVDTTLEEKGMPQTLQVGTVDTDNIIKKLAVAVGGTPTIQINGITHVTAFTKFSRNALLGADVKIAQGIPIATGFVSTQNYQATLTNSGVTTPNLYANSTNKMGYPILAGQQNVDANSNDEFLGINFTGLWFDATNLDYVQIVFQDGHSDKFTAAELAGLFAAENPADADGLLGGMTVISNIFGQIEKVTIYAASSDLLVTTTKF